MENSTSRRRWRISIIYSRFISPFFGPRLTEEETPLTKTNIPDTIPSQIKEVHELITKYQPENEEEITRLFQTIGPDVDFDVLFEEENTLVHEAVIHKRPKILQELLSKRNFNLNVKNKNGNTPMISLLKACVKCGEKYWNKLDRNVDVDENENENTAEEKKWFCKEHFSCLKILHDKNCDKESKNQLGLNAVSYASMCQPKQRSEYLKMLLDETTANQINYLYKLLYNKLDSSFLTKLQEGCKKNHLINSNLLNLMWKDAEGEYTLLQYTCRWGMKKSAKHLLKSNAKIDFAPLVQYLPIQLACDFSHPNVLSLLIMKKNSDTQFAKTLTSNQNLFHIAVKNITDSKKAFECLKILLKFKEKIGNVHDTDIYGRTPLHYAVMSDDDDCIVELLENGAPLFKQDNWKETPLMNISRSAFKKFLDNMITDSRFKEKSNSLKTNTTLQDKQMRSIILDFEKLIVKRRKWTDDENNPSLSSWDFKNCLKLSSEENDSFSQSSADETISTLPTNFLCKIKNTTELQKLMAHPVFSIIIYFKWLKCRSAFLACQILFFIFSVIYTYFLVANEGKSENDIRPRSLLLETLLNSQNSTSDPKEITVIKASDIFQNFLLVLLYILLIIFFFLEGLKMIHQMIIKYLYDFNNILRIVGLCLSMAVLIQINTCLCSELKAFSILITWLDFAFTVGEYPSLALYISIFRKALLRLIQFLIVYSGLLIGFASSFHFLFRSKNPDFSNIFDAFFKTLGILSGDFGADNIPFNAYPIVSHVIFTLYIFVTTLILINIMAEMIAKVKILSEKPFLHKMLAQVNIIKHYEDNYMKNKFLIKIINLCRKNKECSNTNEDDDSIFEIILNGKRNKLKHHIVFENYPQEKVRIKRVDDDESTMWKKIGVFGLFEGVDDVIIQKAKKIIKKKSIKNEKSKKENEVLTFDAFTKEINELKQKISVGQKRNQPEKGLMQRTKNRSV